MSNLNLSKRALETPPSPIRKLAPKARAAVAAGKQVYHLNIGQPDIKSPVEFFDGLRKYNNPIVGYEVSEGNLALRQAWSAYMQKSINLNFTPEQILITTGASEALIFLFMILCDPGDEIIVFDPTYANYMGFAAISGVNLVSVQTKLEDNFALPVTERILHRISARTRAILLCSPNNPTGTAYSRRELQSLIDICNERDIFLIADETYREFVFDNLEPISVFHIEPNNQRLIVVDSLSKRFSLCGARIGCVFTRNEAVLKNMLNLAQARLASPSIEQLAAAHMLNTVSTDYVKRTCLEYQNRRDTIFNNLKNMANIGAVKPHGAFYTVLELPVESAENFIEYMLEEFVLDNKTIFLAPASGFYTAVQTGLNQVRLAYVLESSELHKAMCVFSAGLEQYLKKQ